MSGSQTEWADPFDSLRIGAPRRAGALVMVPLLRSGPRLNVATPEPDVARAPVHLAEVPPVGDMPQILAHNDSPEPALLFEGEVLLGGRQNRALNATVSLAPRSATAVPVTCVEAGRWSPSPQAFGIAPFLCFPALRASISRSVTRSLARGLGRSASQPLAWREIATRLAITHTGSATLDLAALHVRFASRLEASVAALAPEPDQIGAAFWAQGRLLCLERFDGPRTYARLQPRLVRAAGLEALEAKRSPGARAEVDTEAFIARIADARACIYEAVRQGRELRFSSPGLCGSALMVGPEIVHLVAFPSRCTA